MSSGADVEVVILRGRLQRADGLLNDAPIVSKYHGGYGFDQNAFHEDYEAWRVKCRAYLSTPQGVPHD